MLSAPDAAAIRAAAERIAPLVRAIPLVRLEAPESDAEIWLKLECLQPIRSFKLRGAANAMLSLEREGLREGVWTASAGNMAQGVAWCARALGVACTVVVPETAPRTKLDAIARMGATIVPVPFADWFRIYETRRYPGMRGHFIHAFADPAVMAGNGTIALELLEELPDCDAVLVPYGGGGLSCGVAAGLRSQSASGIPVHAVEVETAAPLAAALAAGEPVPIDHRRSFVDGIGGPKLFPEMWALARELLAGSVVVTLQQIAQAIRTLATRCSIVAEGAGAATVAAALTGKVPGRRLVCIVSGGNLEPGVLATILQGELP